MVTLGLVATVFTAEQQGWYYSFLSVAALYTLFDLGLSIVLVQVAAHLFVGTAWSRRGELTGDAVAFKTLIRWGGRHYLVLAAIFAALLIPGGWYFFSYEAMHAQGVGEWQGAWVALVTATALSMLGIPFLSVIEGSGIVAQANAVRLGQGVAGALGCWVVLLAGGGLWATAAVSALGTVVLWLWLLTKWPSLVSVAREAPGDDSTFSREVWPLYWRVGITWISGYVLTQIYTPILLHFQGGTVAGQMGLSLAIVNMLGLVAQSWVARHVPAMGMAAARKDWLTLDRLFSDDFKLSCLVYGAGVACILAVRVWLGDYLYAERILPPWLLVGLCIVGFVNHIIGLLAAQLRSFRQEPLVWIALLGAMVTLPCAIFGAKFHGAQGVVLSVVSVQLAMTFPLSCWLWMRSNKILKVEAGCLPRHY